MYMPKGYSKYNQGGWKHKKGSKNLMSKNSIGTTANEKNGRWAGSKVSYQALHNWIRSHYKKTKNCEQCKIIPGIDSRGHTKLQWANRTKNYVRDRKDWICLCPRCHKEFDNKIKKKHKYAKTT